MNILAKVLEAKILYQNSSVLDGLADLMFEMYTEHGLPPNVSLSAIKAMKDLDRMKCLFVLSKYQKLFLDHRRLSGDVDGEKLASIQSAHIADLQRFYSTGSLG